MHHQTQILCHNGRSPTSTMATSTLISRGVRSNAVAIILTGERGSRPISVTKIDATAADKARRWSRAPALKGRMCAMCCTPTPLRQNDRSRFAGPAIQTGVERCFERSFGNNGREASFGNHERRCPREESLGALVSIDLHVGRH